MPANTAAPNLGCEERFLETVFDCARRLYQSSMLKSLLLASSSLNRSDEGDAGTHRRRKRRRRRREREREREIDKREREKREKRDEEKK